MAAEPKLLLPIDYVVLNVLKEKADTDPERYAVLAALEGLTVIGGCWRGYGETEITEPPPYSEMLPVPRWIIDTLGAGWVMHRAAALRGKTFGETLGIEGGGQGRRPAKDQWNHWLRDLRLASELYQCPSSERMEQPRRLSNGGSGSAWLMLSGLALMRQASFSHGQVFDLSPSVGDGFVPGEVDVGRR